MPPSVGTEPGGACEDLLRGETRPLFTMSLTSLLMRAGGCEGEEREELEGEEGRRGGGRGE